MSARFATPEQHAGGAEHHDELQDICRRLRRFSVTSTPAADRAAAAADRKRILDEAMSSLRMIEEAAAHDDADDMDVDAIFHYCTEGLGIVPEPMDIDEAGSSCHGDFQETSGVQQMHDEGEEAQGENEEEMVVYDLSVEEETTTTATEQNTVPEPKHDKGKCNTCSTCQVLLETIQQLLQHQN